MCSRGFYSLSSILTTAHTHTHNKDVPTPHCEQPEVPFRSTFPKCRTIPKHNPARHQCRMRNLFPTRLCIDYKDVGRKVGCEAQVRRYLRNTLLVLTIMHLFAFQTLTNLQECPQGVYAECPRGTVRVIFVSTYSQYTNLLDMEPPQLLMFRYSTFTN